MFMFLQCSEIFWQDFRVQLCLKHFTSILHPMVMLDNDHISSVQAASLNTRETVTCENLQS